MNDQQPGARCSRFFAASAILIALLVVLSSPYGCHFGLKRYAVTNQRVPTNSRPVP